MSTGAKRSYAVAMAGAEALRGLFDGCYEKWEIAGSIRRKRPQVGDVEHVIIPRFGEMQVENGMFAMTERVNMLWYTLDLLRQRGEVEKAIYTDGRPRWGEKYRGFMFRGVKHEIFTADEQNWGCILTIRTGPAEFSQRMVGQLHGTLLRQDRGYLRYRDGTIHACPTERHFFELCREAWKEPEDRDG